MVRFKNGAKYKITKLSKKTDGVCVMVKNRKWEKIEEWCAFTPDRSLDWHTKASYPPKCLKWGQKQHNRKLSKKTGGVYVMVKNRTWEKIEEWCAFKPDRSIDWHRKAPYTPKKSSNGVKDNTLKNK